MPCRRSQSPGNPAIRQETIRKKIARYKSYRDDLLQAWRASKAEKQVRVVEKTGPVNEPSAAKKKQSLRTETQTGNVNYLAKVMDAENHIDVLEQRLAALLQTKAPGPGDGLARLTNLTDDDLERLTPDDLENFTDDELLAIATRLRAKCGPSDLPVLTKEDLHEMAGAELTALETQCLAEIQRARNPTVA